MKKYSWAKIFTIFATLSFFLRCALLIWEKNQIEFSAPILVKTFAVGFFLDLLALGYIAFIPLLYYTFVSNNFFNSKLHQKITKAFYFIFLYIITFSIVAEIVFWEEFQVRFNFIAVDYLIYTTEVIGNIMESYPIFPILATILAVVLAIFCFTEKKVLITKYENFSQRLKKFAIYLSLLVLAFFTVDSSKITRISDNNYVNETSANGIYQLFSAYFNNELDYNQLYKSQDLEKTISTLRHSISKQEPSSKFLNSTDISRLIAKSKAGAPEKKHNIIFVTIESLSADFMTSFGNENNLTPNLEALAKKSLFFTNLKATGTRTVRGLEALSLSIPPTPGNSIVRRPNNDNMFNISSPLKDRGYDAKFLYGGFGYFDDMNAFFAGNGFEIVDRANLSKEEITFANVWGVADEDLYDRAIKEADKSYAAGKPFINFIMTTSNHRPYTFPEGKIDEAQKTRRGAVKYTDYAIGQLVKKAQSKKWFDNTIFVFVSDHCAGSAGNTDVPLWRYQIPAMFYAPKIIKPKVFAKNTSQINIAPTLLGFLNLSYKSKFFGIDVINNEKTLDEYAFVSTYADVGYFKNKILYLLKPKKEVKVFDVNIKKYGDNGSEEIITKNYSEGELEEAISYYQGASYLFSNGNLKNFDPKN